MDKRCYIHTMEYDLAIKTNEVMIHAMTWLKLDNTILSKETSYKKIHILHDSTKSPKQANPYVEKVYQ